MTSEVRTKVKCNKCQVEMKCPNCGNTQYMLTPFSHWLRARKGKLSSYYVDNENLDYIWFPYRDGWFITIEEKTHGGKSSDAQLDTHSIIRQMLELSSGKKINTWRGRRKIEYRGHYVISLQNTTPIDSDWVEINGVRFTEGTIPEITHILMYGKSRITP